MILNQTNIKEFSFNEAMCNSNGKTSGSKLAGFIGIVIGGLGFLSGIVGVWYKLPDAIGLAGLSSTLITGSYVLFGYSKKKATKDDTNQEVSE